MKYFSRTFIWFLIILSAFINSTCKKSSAPPAVLPPITQEGKNTVGFTIDGDVWVPYAKCGFGSDPCGEISARYSSPLASPDGIDFQFERERGNKSSFLSISTAGTGGSITRTGNKIDSISVGFQGENWNGSSGAYSGPMPGSLFSITKIDHLNQIISGNFKFVLRENGSSNVLTIDNGRFDFKFNACKCSN